MERGTGGQGFVDSHPGVLSLKFAKQKHCHPERSLARSLRQTQSKDLRLHFINYAANFRRSTLAAKNN